MRRAGIGVVAALLLQAGTAAAALTAAQVAWLDQHAPVRFAPERDYPPFVFVDRNGLADGLSIAVLRRVQQHTGLATTVLPPRPLAEVLALVQGGGADLVAALRPTPERAAYLLFTQPYVSVPAVLVVRAGVGAAETLDRYAGQPVAVGAGYAVESVVRAAHPAVAWQAVPDDAAALHGVAGGRYAAAVVDTASLAYIARREGLENLAAAGHVGFDYTLSFGVRKDWPELRDILDEGLRAIPASERRAMLAQWLPPAEARAVEPVRGPLATPLGLLMLGLGVAWGVWGWWGWHRRAGRR